MNRAMWIIAIAEAIRVFQNTAQLMMLAAENAEQWNCRTRLLINMLKRWTEQMRRGLILYRTVLGNEVIAMEGVHYDGKGNLLGIAEDMDADIKM